MIRVRVWLPESEAEVVFDAAAKDMAVPARADRSLERYVDDQMNEGATDGEVAAWDTAVRMARIGDFDSCRLAIAEAQRLAAETLKTGGREWFV